MTKSIDGEPATSSGTSSAPSSASQTVREEKEHFGTIRLRNEDVPVRTLWIEQRKLRFFVENPRIYSIVRSDGREPDQKEIYDQLLEMEHVRELKEDIKRNGGLIDPLIVREKSLEVLEGNSRLAAYRWLNENDENPLTWNKVKCTLLPANIDERLVYALLGQYHVKGKKDWGPYEKAGFLFRRFRHHKDSVPTVAAELSMKPGEAQQHIEVFEFMQLHKEHDPQRWSYYEEYLKSRRIKKARDNYADFDKIIVQQIKSGAIDRAVDVRDKLPIVCEANPRIIKKFIEGKITLEDAHERAKDAGGENADYKRLHKLRLWLAAAETEDEFREASAAVAPKILFELGKIETLARRLKQRLTSDGERSD